MTPEGPRRPLGELTRGDGSEPLCARLPYRLVPDLERLEAGPLLGRPERALDLSEVAEALRGRCILVTGAGGSVGVPLVERLLSYRPARLVLLDSHEDSLARLQRRLCPPLPRRGEPDPCGAPSAGWRERAEKAFRVHAEREARRYREGRASSQKVLHETASAEKRAGCLEQAKKAPTARQFLVWLQCIDGHRERRTRLRLGRLRVPEAGVLSVAGRSLADVRTDVLARLRSIYPAAQVDLRLVGVRSFKVYVAGQVETPGAVQATAATRASEVFTGALALRPEASRRNIELRVVPRHTPDEGGVIEFSVTDSGPGIKDEVISRLYEAFFSTKAEGLGIGLSLCRSIVESHRGRIKAENLYNGPSVVGCRFTFTVPVETTHSHVETAA